MKLKPLVLPCPACDETIEIALTATLTSVPGAMPSTVTMSLDGDLSAVKEHAAAKHAPPEPEIDRDCPHAGPFRYCNGCQVNPCPIGLGRQS